MNNQQERTKHSALRIGDDSAAHARAKYAEGTPERDLFENVYTARLPYALMAKLSEIPHTDIRDMVTGRKTYSPLAKERLCGPLNKLIDKGLELGIFPCSDLAVVEPVTMLLLSQMATEQKLNKMVAFIQSKK